MVDGTFLKNNYKGVLLVATSVDGNSNLYHVAFGVVDSKNERSWEWFMRQLKVVIADDHHLAFFRTNMWPSRKRLRTCFRQLDMVFVFIIC